MARRHGWPDTTLQQLEKFEELELEEPVKVALRFAERMTRDSNRVDDALFQQLRAHYNEAAVVELAAVVGLFNYFNRFNNAFQIEPTRPGDR
ncbi:MAG: carboxymuconolactone decarboxylase family protein [Terriglobales bacterium]